MKINDEKDKIYKRFELLSNGEAFRFYGEYFIKVNWREEQDNAINLVDGSSKYFCASDMVEVIECEIVVK